MRRKRMSYETAVMQPERKENLTKKRVTLNDGNTIPVVGFGVFLIPNDGPTYDAVLSALKAGYRHIDTDAAYFNESDVGKAVRDRGLPRVEILINRQLSLKAY